MVKRSVKYTERQEKNMKEVDEYLLKLNQHGEESDAEDKEVKTITSVDKSTARAKDLKKQFFLRQNGIIMKNTNNASLAYADFAKNAKMKGAIYEKIDQNFSKSGERLTSIAPLGLLNLRDKIVSSFNIHDAKQTTVL